MIREIRNNKLFISLVTLFFFLAFTLNITGALTSESFVANDKFSENLVRYQMYCKGQLYDDQLIGLKDLQAVNQHPECTKTNYVAYNSQFGLQGKLGVILQQILHLNSGAAIVVYQLLTALLSAMLFALLALWVRIRFGMSVAIVFSIFVSLSPMIVSFSRNLYWALPLMITPIVYILYFYTPSLSRKTHSWFLAGLALLLYLRFLCGYEYITTFTIMVVSVTLYELILSGMKYKSILKRIALVGLMPFVAFMLTFSTHVLSLNQQTGSTSKSIEIIKNRAQDRTINSQVYTQYAYMSLDYAANDFYKASNEYIKYDKIKDSGSVPVAILVAYTAHLLLPVVHTSILSGVFAAYAQSFSVFIIILVLLYRYRAKWVSKKQAQQVRALYVAATVGLAGYFSWLIFAYSHSLVHAHINGILMYLPTALFGFIILGLYIEFLIKKYIRRK